MPLYDFVCTCGKVGEQFFTIASCPQSVQCQCGKLATKVFSPSRVRGDYPGYTCPITDKWIEGRKAHRENLALHGCRVLESGEREAMVKRKSRLDAALDAKLEETIELDLKTMPDEKFEVLAGELVRGGDADLIRITPGN